MKNQRHLFQIPANVHYFNCAYMSPLLNASVEAGQMGMQKKMNPILLTKEDFFDEAEEIRKAFGKLISCNPEQTALIPSASYGLASAIQNISANTGDHAITIAAEFPSDYYSVKRWCDTNKKRLEIIDAYNANKTKAEDWNNRILEAIQKNTAMVVMSAVHWSDGTLFNINEIGRRCRETNTFFIVDGTQSVGALPMHVMDCNIDALICAGYKWLFGPYTSGVAYYSEIFNDGKPLEESWMHRINASEFTRLTEYTDNYKSGAARYNMGQYSNFVLNPMLLTGLNQVLEWTPEFIQQYCELLTDPFIQLIQEKGWHIEEDAHRATHLFGLQLPKHLNLEYVIEKLKAANIFVSQRGNNIRISPHVYNTEEDIAALMQVINSID